MEDQRVSFYVDRYGVFRKILKKPKKSISDDNPTIDAFIKPKSTWLRLILLFWNPRVMKTAFRFGVAAVLMNHYEKLGFAALLLCFAI